MNHSRFYKAQLREPGATFLQAHSAEKRYKRKIIFIPRVRETRAYQHILVLDISESD